MQQGATEEQNRCGKGTEQEVLHRCFHRARARPPIGHECIGAEGHRLETEKDAQEVDRAREHHGAERSEDHQDVEFASLETMLAQVRTG